MVGIPDKGPPRRFVESILRVARDSPIAAIADRKFVTAGDQAGLLQIDAE